jgi:hypothetical protein
MEREGKEVAILSWIAYGRMEREGTYSHSCLVSFQKDREEREVAILTWLADRNDGEGRGVIILTWLADRRMEKKGK